MNYLRVSTIISIEGDKVEIIFRLAMAKVPLESFFSEALVYYWLARCIWCIKGLANCRVARSIDRRNWVHLET